MKKTLLKRVVAGACVALAAASVMMLAGCGSQGSEAEQAAGEDSYILINEGQLTIGSDLDFKPMEYLDANGNKTGFGVAMTQEICNRLGLEMNFLDPQNFDSLLTQVNAGETMDIAVSSITITDERRELVDFSIPYYQSNLAIVCMPNAFASREEMNVPEVVVAVQSGSSGEDWVKENLPNATCKAFTGPTDCMTALVAGQAQVSVYDDPIAQTLTAEGAQFAECSVFETIATGEEYGIAVNKNNQKLLADINACIEEMLADGTIERLTAEYLG